jgi:hypothetical protein
VTPSIDWVRRSKSATGDSSGAAGAGSGFSGRFGEVKRRRLLARRLRFSFSAGASTMVPPGGPLVWPGASRTADPAAAAAGAGSCPAGACWPGVADAAGACR